MNQKVILGTAGEREAFEKALGVLHPSWTFDDDGTGGYHNPRTEAAWQGWQASREAPPVAPYAETTDYKRGWSDGCIWAKEQFSLEPVAPDPNSLQGWIAVSERLPTDEETNEYLCAYRHPQFGHRWIMDVVRYSAVFNAFTLKHGQEIVYWMPLPAAPTHAPSGDKDG